MFKSACVIAAFAFLGFAVVPAFAQTIGYADALDQLAAACGADIAKYCKNENLGGGRVRDCLLRNQSTVSARCIGSVNSLGALLQKRAAARASVMRVCDVDIKRRCSGVQPGDGNLMECFYKTKENISPACQQAVADAGYEVALGPSSRSGSINLSSGDLVSSLQGVEAAANTISASQLRQLVNQSLTDPSRTNRVDRPPLYEQLDSLAQITIAIQFDFNSARIRPDSFRAVGLMADALYHPYLQGYRFLIVGHTDAKGSREYNLKLSQQRADAIRAALINPFGISPARIEAVGLGEEQLLNRRNPEAAENRRVQLINIGK
ncbi:MAG TPA: OmpA family protein [Pseudolabrys sp.]|nr:OmpA family protein [Pseudolabrys sp.]